MKIRVLCMAVGAWCGFVFSSEVTLIKNHVYNWTGTHLRMRCTKTTSNDISGQTYSLPASDSNTIIMFPGTCGQIEFTTDLFEDEEDQEIESNSEHSGSVQKESAVFKKFRIVYNWLNVQKISLIMKRPFKDDIREEIVISDLPLSPMQYISDRVRCLATVLKAEGARKSYFFYFNNPALED